jgi:hypothetical protein
MIFAVMVKGSVMMATCRDCVGYNFCSRNRDGLTDYYREEVACSNVEDLCCVFTNKADYVPVVRCSQCRKRYTTECALWFSQLDDKQYFCGAMMKDVFFCAYGERKTNNE